MKKLVAKNVDNEVVVLKTKLRQMGIEPLNHPQLWDLIVQLANVSYDEGFDQGEDGIENLIASQI